MASNNRHPLFIDISSLGDISKAEMNFYDTSFFQPKGPLAPRLPTPTEIFQQHEDTGRGVIKLLDLNIVVKFGPCAELRLEEAQTMRAIRQLYPDSEIPVPEVYGWRKWQGRVYIYMSLIPGKTLRQAWPCLSETEKKAICVQLSQVVASLRRISQASANRFIGSVSGGTVQDRFFKPDYEKGPFYSIESFNDWLLAAAVRVRPGPGGKFAGMHQDGLYRDWLSDSGDICFTHGDLTLGNIVVDGTPGFQRIAGIIDWEQAGWYPEYWEYCKMLYAVADDHGWRSEGWADKVMTPFDNEWFAFAEYSLWRCP